MASRKSDGGAMSAELLQTLAEALRASSQAQQTMAEAMLALAGGAGAGSRAPNIRSRSGSQSDEAYKHVGRLKPLESGLEFVEDPPGTYRAVLTDPAAREKKIRIEFALAEFLGTDELRTQSSAFFEGLQSFLSLQSNYSLIASMTCADS